MGVDFYAYVVVGSKLTPELEGMIEKELSGDELAYFKEDQRDFFLENEEVTLNKEKMEVITGYEDGEETYIGTRFSGRGVDWEIKPVDLADAAMNFYKATGLQAQIFVLPRMSY